MFFTYQFLQEKMKGKIAWEHTYAIVHLRDGDDFVATYNGVECLRVRRDGSFLLTIPEWAGMHWLRQYGEVLNITSIRTFPWRNGLETHKRLRVRKGNTITEFWTKKHLVGQLLDNHKPTEIHVPKEDIPRKRVLTTESKKRLLAQIAEWKEWRTNAAAIRRLRGEPPPSNNWWEKTLRYEWHFTSALKKGDFKAQLLDTKCSPMFFKNLDRWKYSDAVVEHFNLQTEFAE